MDSQSRQDVFLRDQSSKAFSTAGQPRFCGDGLSAGPGGGTSSLSGVVPSALDSCPAPNRQVSLTWLCVRPMSARTPAVPETGLPPFLARTFIATSDEPCRRPLCHGQADLLMTIGPRTLGSDLSFDLRHCHRIRHGAIISLEYA